ncbi:outer membrane receptor protein involved in Fe transport [Sphingopyxis panaciterrae]|uniref:TonB-dependent receptor domain-containing protein n=1 Tax=Sphingopyxis panaciterrae TaxID=363841 RepID=UPI00142496EE|nr:outer membrane receptor protein involved in Fe transport [Sphingopyxis panaciterrae]
MQPDRACRNKTSLPGQPRDPAALFVFNQRTSSIAGYLQGTVKIVPTLDLTLGARYTHDDKDGSFVGRNFNPAAASIQTNETTQLSSSEGRWTYRVTSPGVRAAT